MCLVWHVQNTEGIRVLFSKVHIIIVMWISFICINETIRHVEIENMNKQIIHKMTCNNVVY